MPKQVNIEKLQREQRISYARDLLRSTTLNTRAIAKRACLATQTVSRINQPREIKRVDVRIRTRAVLEKRLANAIVFAEKFLIANKNVSPQALVNLIAKNTGDLCLGYRCVRELERRGLVKRSAVGYKRVGSKTKVVIERRRMVKELLDSGLDLPEIADKMKISYDVVCGDFFALDTIAQPSIEERIDEQRRQVLGLIHSEPEINLRELTNRLSQENQKTVYRRTRELLAENPRALNSWNPKRKKYTLPREVAERIQEQKKQILAIISSNPSITTREIARLLGIPRATILVRMRELSKENSQAIINWKKQGRVR